MNAGENAANNGATAIDDQANNTGDGAAQANDNSSVNIDQSNNSTNDSGNTTFTLTIGDVQLNNASLSSSVSGVRFGGLAGRRADIDVSTGNINNQNVSGNNGMYINNNNTGVGTFQNSQSVNVGTVNMDPVQ